MVEYTRCVLVNLMVYIYFFNILVSVTVTESMPELTTVQQWADDLSKTLQKDFNVISGHQILEDGSIIPKPCCRCRTGTQADCQLCKPCSVVHIGQKMRDMEHQERKIFTSKAYNNRTAVYQEESYIQLNFEKIDPVRMVQDMAKNLSDMLKRKMEILNKSVVAAEEAATKHSWNNNIKRGDVDYIDGTALKNNDSRLTYNTRFKEKMVIPHNSSVHVPVEIYSGDIEILNGLQWSAALDKTFAENFNSDPEILWQYFGSQSGFMRTFPASVWVKVGNVDLFDVRRRPWYTQGSSSPKDMMILIDTSGSVHGQSLELIKVAVRSLLDTLGENDFVNIATFSDKASLITGCFKGAFVQANYKNKEKLVEEVTKIQARGMASFAVGLTFAFEQFLLLKNETEGRRGAGCNRMIMLLTDGGTEYAENVFEKYNPKGNKTYRVFTYAVGPTANPVKALHWMACANRGYFSQIPAMGAVRSKVQEYLRKPLQALESHGFKKHAEFLVKNDPRGLGMMTTVTLPVYNRTQGSTNQTILGVMGIDVTTAAMLKYASTRKFGPNGFTFAINTNGYIVFHPNLPKKQDNSDQVNVDFLDLEVESPEKEILRKNMIDLDNGTMIMSSYSIAQDKRHVDHEVNERERLYSYKKIDETTFSLGVSIPKYHKYHLNVTVDMKHLMEIEKTFLNDTTALLIADWEYHENFTDGNMTGTVLDLQEALENHTQYQWNMELINHLLWDLKVTSFLHQYWESVHNSSSAEGMVGAFVGTIGGLTQIYPKREDLVSQFMEMRDTWKASYFRRAINSQLLMFSASFINGKDDLGKRLSYVTAVKSVEINNTNLDPKLKVQDLKYMAAVVGAVLTRKMINERMVNTTVKFPSVFNCSNSDQLACYLLDDGAFLIATNQEEYSTRIGQFFGKVDAEVMKQLYNNSFYKRLVHYDDQSMCDIQKNITSAGALSFKIPSLNLFYEFLTLNWWSSVVTWTFANFNIYSLLYPSSNIIGADAGVPLDKKRHCVIKFAQYYFSDLHSLNGSTDCNRDCSRNFVAVRVLGTNLALVITEKKTDCDLCKIMVPKDDILQETEILSAEMAEHFCNKKPRYRKPTDRCYDYDHREDDTKCMGTQTHPAPLTMIIVVTSITLVLRW